MYVDMKKTSWERVHLPDEMTKEKMAKLIEENSAADLNSLLTNDKGLLWENMVEADEYLELKDNDSQATIEVYAEGEHGFSPGELLLTNAPHSDEVTVNALELASELAHKRVVEGGCQQIWEDEDEEQTTYTEEAQQLYDEYYDDYKNIITGGKF